MRRLKLLLQLLAAKMDAASARSTYRLMDRHCEDLFATYQEACEYTEAQQAIVARADKRVAFLRAELRFPTPTAIVNVTGDTQ